MVPTMVLYVASALGATTVELVSRAAEPTLGRGLTGVLASISGDGRYAVFVANAPNVLVGQVDDNQGEDVFLYDRTIGDTTLVSHVPGMPLRAADGPSTAPVISANGEVIVFISRASNLVSGIDSNGFGDVFLYHRPTGAVSLVSHVAGASTTAAGGVDSFWGPPAVSGDGGLVAFASWATNLVAGQIDTPQTQDVFLLERASGAITLVSHVPESAVTCANVRSAYPVISADGRYVAFTSPATDLVAGQIDLFSFDDLFLYERATGAVSLVSHKAGAPTEAANSVLDRSYAISHDGAFVAFASYAENIVAGEPTNARANVYLYDRSSTVISLVSHRRGAPPGPAWFGDSRYPVISADGLVVAFVSNAETLVEGQADADGTDDVFFYDHASGVVSLVSHVAGEPTAAAGASPWPLAISADGKLVAFQSPATTLVAGTVDGNGGHDIFLFDRGSGVVSLVSHAWENPLRAGDEVSEEPSLSADGSTIAFSSYAGDLIPTPNQVAVGRRTFFFDRSSGVISEPTLSPGPPSATANAASRGTPVMSGDGRFLAFSSMAGNLIAGQIDDNRGYDVFLYRRDREEVALISHTPESPVTAGALTYGRGLPTGISDDGAFVIFESSATNLVAGQNDSNGDLDVFLYETGSGLVTLVSHATGQPNATGNCPSQSSVISGDGAYVAFTSCASDLVAGRGGPLNQSDVYLFERVTGATRLLSHAAGAPATAANGASVWPALSGDGSRIAFESSATDLVHGAADTNGFPDVFVFDRDTGVMSIASHTPASEATTGNGPSRDPSISGDGSAVVFRSFARDLVSGQNDGNNGCSGFISWCWGDDVFLYDADGAGVTLVSHTAGDPTTTANRPSAGHVLSVDGRFVAFVSAATDLVPGQIDVAESSDVFLWDRMSGLVTLASHVPGSQLEAANGGSNSPAISMDGSSLAFLSGATDLVAGQVDGNSAGDVFHFRRTSGVVSLVSHVPTSPLTAAGSFSFWPSISGNGLAVGFSSVADNLVAYDYNLEEDVFLCVMPLPGVTVNPTIGLTTHEAGTAAQVTVVLDTQPIADVTIPIVSSDPTEASVSPASLVFTPVTWSTPQVVTVYGVDDPDFDGPIAFVVETAPAVSTDPEYSGLDAADVAGINLDNESGPDPQRRSRPHRHLPRRP